MARRPSIEPARTSPVTADQKRDWIERHGGPTYLDRIASTTTLPSGTVIAVQERREKGVWEEEIQNVYGECFNLAKTARSRANILRDYTTNFPNLAFDPHSWLWPLWQQWRAEYTTESRALLRGLARGIQLRGNAWMSAKRLRTWTLEMARRRLETLKNDPEIRRLARRWNEVRQRDSPLRDEYARRYLTPLAARIQVLCGYKTSATQLQRHPLSVILRLAATRPMGVREANLR